MEPTATATGFRHEAFFYASEEEFLARAIPYLEEGVAAGEAVLVVLPQPRRRIVQEAIGADAETIDFWSMEMLGRNPARLIAAWRDFLGSREDHRGVRGLGEPVPPGRSPVEQEECELHERLFNLAFGEEQALTVMCPYDTRALADTVLKGAERSHPICSGLHGKIASPRYSLDAPLAGSLRPPGRPAVNLPFGRSDLALVRHVVGHCAHSAGLDTRRNEDLVLSACEVATNSIRHGGGNGRLQLWDEDGSLVLSVRDAGRIEDPLVGRERPRDDRPSGRGLWLVNQLCDLVQIRSGRDGTEVRLRMSFGN